MSCEEYRAIALLYDPETQPPREDIGEQYVYRVNALLRHGHGEGALSSSEVLDVIRIYMMRCNVLKAPDSERFAEFYRNKTRDPFDPLSRRRIGESANDIQITSVIRGDGPYSQDQINMIADAMSIKPCTNYGKSPGLVVVVVGRKDFVVSDLKQPDDPNCEVLFFTQESFIGMYLFNIHRIIYATDPDVTGHPGLDALRKMGWEWPNSQGGIRKMWPYPRYNDMGFMRRHELHTIYKYSVEAKHDEPHRRTMLRGALAPGNLKLKDVVYHIAHLIQYAESTGNRNHSAAIPRWRADLAWIKEQYYTGIYAGMFIWPCQ